MDNLIVVVMPVLGRPGHAAEAYEQAMGAQRDVPYRVVFVPTEGDDAEIRACRATGADVLVSPVEGWAAKLNYAFRRTSEPWLLCGADDLCFCPGWADVALERAGGAGVVGTNDLANARVQAGTHSTHPLIARWYAEEYGTIDQPGLVAHPGYRAWFADDELVQTARARRAWVFVRGCHVEHLHPHYGKADDDATYRLGQAASTADRLLFEQRRPLWQRQRVPAAVMST